MVVVVFNNGSFISSYTTNIGELDLARVQGVYQLSDGFQYYKDGKFYDENRNEIFPIKQYNLATEYVDLSQLVPKQVVENNIFEITFPAGGYIINSYGRTIARFVSTGAVKHLKFLEAGRYTFISLDKLCKAGRIVCRSSVVQFID